MSRRRENHRSLLDIVLPQYCLKHGTGNGSGLVGYRETITLIASGVDISDLQSLCYQRVGTDKSAKCSVNTGPYFFSFTEPRIAPALTRSPIEEFALNSPSAGARKTRSSV